MAHTKRIAHGAGKNDRWAVTPTPGAHPKNECIPLTIVLRDHLHIADTAREAKQIIYAGDVLVNKIPQKDHAFGIGLMDVIELPKLGKAYRATPTANGFNIQEIPLQEADKKLCKITNKTLTTKGKLQLQLHDGRTLIPEKGTYQTQDSILIHLPDQTIISHIPFSKGNLALAVKGRHRGEKGKIKEMIPGTANRKPITTLENLQTLTDYLIVTGEKESVITI